MKDTQGPRAVVQNSVFRDYAKLFCSSEYVENTDNLYERRAGYNLQIITKINWKQTTAVRMQFRVKASDKVVSNLVSLIRTLRRPAEKYKILQEFQ